MDRRLLRSLVPPRDRLGPDPGAGDADLLQRYGDCRDERAFEELLTRHGPTVWGVCRRMLSRREDAEDAFQATFVALIRLAESGRRPRNLPGWLVRVAGRISSNVRREAGRSRRRQAITARPESAADVAEASYDAAYAAFREEVAALPDGLRAAYLLCELGGTPQPQAAAQLGLKPSALSARLTRARQRLEARLIARGLAPSIASVVLTGTATTLAAMPTRLVIAAQTLAAQTVVIPSTLSALAATGVPAVITKLKLVTLGGLVAAAVGLTLGAGAGLMPGAAAQAEKPAPPVAEAPKPPPKPADREQLLSAALLAQEAAMLDDAVVALMVQKQKAAAKFEYRFHDFPTVADQFKKLLESEAVEGFEFAGTTPPSTDGGARFTPLVVFKRPNPKLAAAATSEGVPLNTKASWDVVRSGERAAPDPRAERLKEAVEAVEAAIKVTRASLKKPEELAPFLERAAAGLKMGTELSVIAARIQLTEAGFALDRMSGGPQRSHGSDLHAALLIATEAVKRAEGGTPTPAADSPRHEPLSMPQPHVTLPPPAAPPVIVPQPTMPLTTTPTPVAPDQAVENLGTLILSLRTESELRKIQADIQRSRDAKRRESDTTPEQAAKVVEALKALGVRASVSQTVGVKGLADVMVHNPRPGDLELAEAMIRAVNSPSTTRVTLPRPNATNDPSLQPALPLPEPIPRGPTVPPSPASPPSLPVPVPPGKS